MSRIAFTRSGAGEPLVLLHSLGLSRSSWDPVVAPLAERFDVIAVDLPGFGSSPPLPGQAEPVPAALAAAVVGLLEDLGVSAPHLAGNSLGGWVALEVAQIRQAASLTLLSPAGLWHQRGPTYARISLRASRWLAQHATRLLSGLAGHRLGRAVLLGQTHGKPGQLTPAYARETIRSLGTCPGFDAVLHAMWSRQYLPQVLVEAPVCVAFGSRDQLLLPWTRRFDQLPSGARRDQLPGCGHVPMADDPAAVVALIERTAALASGGTRSSGDPHAGADRQGHRGTGQTR